MLNDLFDIERGLAGWGVSVSSKHPDVKAMAKGCALRVRLDALGAIDNIDFIANSSALWTLRDGQQNGFPGLKTTRALLALDANARSIHDANWASSKSPAARLNELLRLIRDVPFDTSGEWPKAAHRKRIAERLAQLSSLRDGSHTAAVPAAFERFLLALEQKPPFLANLLAWLKDHLSSLNNADMTCVRDALIDSVALFIDVAAKDFPRDASDPQQIGPVSAALGSGKTSNAGAKLDFCALTGETVRLHMGTFPQPNLPSLGQSYLFSRNEDIPSLSRYGKTATESFPIGSDLIGRLAGALSHLTQPDLKFKTWRLISAESGDKQDLLIAACPAAPDQPFVQPLSGNSAFDDDDAPDFSTFAQKAAQVIGQSAGQFNQLAAQAQVIVLILRAVDPANRKVLYRRSVSSTSFFDAAKNWTTKATQNVPPSLGFYVPDIARRNIAKGFKKPGWVSPLSLLPISRKSYIDGGRRSVNSIGQPAAAALTLFLGHGNTARLARRILHQLLERHTPLLAGLAHAVHKSADHLKNFDPKCELRLDALASSTWIGILLHYLGRNTEVYMHHPAFVLGQFLAAIDAVHVGYCADMRGGQVPPTLIGNSVFSIAGNNPARALEIVQKRWKPYGAWLNEESRIRGKIQKLTGGKDDSLAWDMRRGLSAGRRIRSLIDSLAGQFAREQTPDEIFRAELLLGYMAAPPQPPAKNGAETENDHSNEKIENRGNEGDQP